MIHTDSLSVNPVPSRWYEMDEFVRKVYERGKITIPKELRDIYGVADGDMVKMKIIRVVRAADLARGIPAKEEEIEVDVPVQADDDAKEVA